MNKSCIDIYSITATSIEKYLLLNNWNRDYNFKNKNLMVFDYEGKRLAISASEKFDDFYENVLNVIKTLALYKEKPIIEIIRDINTSYYDRLEFRIISELSEKGKLPLGYASSCIEGLKELILYTTCAEQNAEPICLRVTNYAKELLDNFKLAQTDIGSYIINIDIAIVDELCEQITLEQCTVNIPIEHKIVKRIFTAMKQIDEIVENKISINNTIIDAYKTGITANMCDALLKLKPEKGDVEIDTTIRYASVISRQTGVCDKILIRNNHFYIMNELSKKYHENNNLEDIKLKGMIRSLTKNIIDNQNDKIIHLITYIDGKYRSVKVLLNDSDYRIACDAHRDEKEVEISGVLDMSKKTWILNDVDKFNIL